MESELDTLPETAGSTDKCAGLSYSKSCQPNLLFHEEGSNEDPEVDKYKPDISACMVERKVASLDDCCCTDEEGSQMKQQNMTHAASHEKCTEVLLEHLLNSAIILATDNSLQDK
ncbi:uncharacterized protein LOC117113787 [Anneissia japonica]|uniref:uncharacterized protein LOC117113787 n=1 Tax=Anneissia japonica TaxID=1529436 RepID=UPI001425600A|nr:uncharacterized protein LOC117113787 [Anneissia japonica]XP_033113111.1 uncharacterized protein LOC117113787 [Anneissia japonica]